MKIQRRHSLLTATIGLVVIAAVILADRFGVLTPLEQWLYDQRAKTCQFFTPPPTDRLVHLDIDDATLETVGAWPWPRANLARIISELDALGAKAVAMDIVLSEPQEPRLVLAAATQPAGAPATRPAMSDTNVAGLVETVHDDRQLAEALTTQGEVLVPVTFKITAPPSPYGQAIFEILRGNPELSEPEVARKLEPLDLEKPNDGISDFDRYIRALQDAMFARIVEIMRSKPLTFEQARATLLPNTSPSLAGSIQLRVLRAQYDRARSLVALHRFSLRKPEGSPLILSPQLDLVPIPELSAAAGMTGFVTYKEDADGVIRSVPMVLEHRGALFPQMAFSLACDMLGAKPEHVKLGADRIIIEPPGRQPVVVPVRNRHLEETGRQAGMFFDIPWFGGDEWETMYDPRHLARVQHLSVSQVWQLGQLRDRIDRNVRNARDALRTYFSQNDPARLADLEAAKTPGDLIRLAGEALTEARELGYFEVFKGVRVEDLEAEVRKAYAAQADATAKAGPERAWTAEQRAAIVRLSHELRNAEDNHRLFLTFDALREVHEETPTMIAQLETERSKLRRQLEGRAVLIGWTGTATVADFVPTPLHARCPGPVVHGVIFNGIMTGEMWHATPRWVTYTIVIVLGVATTIAVAAFSPFGGAVCAAMLAIAYSFINGILLFDYGNLLVGFAAPLVTIGAIWSAGTLSRFIAEIAERQRITRRFSNYVDPALVRYVINNPDQAGFEGQVRELSVVFTDLAGFTGLTERLREKSVGILNEYLTLMVPVIREQKGYVNKFMGDGIMCFYGAPEPTADHALAAVATVLKMQSVLPAFNSRLVERGLPIVSMRAGVSTGEMVVGDAGGSEHTDYTVLGDIVNFGARLEGANKFTGTNILISKRTAELAGDAFLMRPIAKLVVVGKTEAELVFEPLGYRRDATDEQRKLVERTQAVVDAFVAGNFRGCLEAVAELERHHGPSKLVDLYREQCNELLQNPPPDGFDGRVVLTAKG